MRLVRSQHYKADLERIVDYIAIDSPRAALVLFETIERQLDLLAQFPKAGRVGRIDGTRELVIARTPYIVAYRIVGETVEIVTVLHGAMQWPDELP